jgi:hypothetical protein
MRRPTPKPPLRSGFRLKIMFDSQNLIVAAIILGASLYAASILLRKTRGFSRKAECAEDCGCDSKSKSPKSAH